MQQTIHAADVDEGAVIGKAAHCSVQHCALFQLGKHALSRLPSPLPRSPNARSTTASSSATSSWMILQAISWPTSFSRSAASLAPLREAGMNARTPISTLNPPLTNPVTSPATLVFSWNAFSRAVKSFGRATLIFDSV